MYLPFYKKGDANQTEKFLSAVDSVQAIVNNYVSLAPMKIFGDMNVKLPHKSNLHKNWFKGAGYNEHCQILYDFIVSNKLVVADLLFQQNV